MRERDSPECLDYSFFLEGYLPTRLFVAIMPSKYMVSVSLDEETATMWDNLPVGERSKRIREAIREAQTQLAYERHVEALRAQIKALKNEVYHLRWGA